jgi:hypothetical protein
MGYYTDGHEKGDNVRYRLHFIDKYFNFELRTYHRWVQLKEEDAIALEELDRKPLAKDLARKQFTSADDSRMQEYHIDCHEGLLKFVSEDNRQIHGADPSVDFPEGTRPLLIISQDESVFYQYLFSSKA